MRISNPVSPLPELYAPWVDEVLGGPLPEERHASCSACAMCTPHAVTAATASVKVFDPGTKCCTYVPTLPNFLVGLILGHDDPATAAGLQSVRRRIADGIGVTPLGLQPDPHYVLIYRHAGDQLFGRSSGLRCPHYVPAGGGQCGIWRYRNGVCATWFCKYERGRVGKRFWGALLQLLTVIERHLSLWAAGELGETVVGLGPALLPYYASRLDKSPELWSPRWVGRCEEFYRAAARLVEPLGWRQVREIAGPEVAVVAGQLRAAYSALEAGELPTPLRLGAVSQAALDDGQVACTGYSPHDMLRLPSAVAEALEHFDGHRSTDEVREQIARQVDERFDRDAVRRLVDFGILQPISPAEANGRC